jgi:2-oxo-4-hydroxy-4-carboxy--5-ureidoimidazoline (OHCU) decarboxylase
MFFGSDFRKWSMFNLNLPMTGVSLPELSKILSSPSELATALSVLFEASPILSSTLASQLSSTLIRKPLITTYAELVDIAISTVNTWDNALAAEFIAGHPRIGESHNLSNLSAKEQGASTTTIATQPDVLRRLAHLNACYERTYPGLRYITFVNGRSRAAIAEEIEDVLGIDHSLESGEPPVEKFKSANVGGDRWKGELDRATTDVGRIAKSRLKAMGVE